MTRRKGERLKASKDGDWPEGSRWLHVWPVPALNTDRVALAFQFEVIGVLISAAPCLLVCPSDARKFMAQIAGLDGARKDDVGVSVRLDLEE